MFRPPRFAHAAQRRRAHARANAVRYARKRSVPREKRSAASATQRPEKA